MYLFYEKVKMRLNHFNFNNFTISYLNNMTNQIQIVL